MPTAAFWAWFLLQGRLDISDGYGSLVIAMPITSLWITLGPLLMQQGEFGLEKLISAFNGPDVSDHWDTEAIQRTLKRFDRCYYWTTLPIAGAAVASVLIGGETIASIVRIDGFAAVLAGIIVIFSVGFTSASGIWGCAKALLTVRAATRATSADWRPFRAQSQQPECMQALYEFCWSTAFIFSAGSVSLPTLFVAQSQLPPASRMIVFAFIGVLALGGLVLFTVPIVWLRQLGDLQKDRILDSLAVPIERSLESVLDADSYSSVELRRREHVSDVAMKLRSEIASLNPVPLPHLLTRGGATLVIPLVLTTAQIAITRML